MENVKIVLKTIIKSIVHLNYAARCEIKMEPHVALSKCGPNRHFTVCINRKFQILDIIQYST